MKNINKPSDYEEIVNRVKLLSTANIRQWGKMDLPQMLVHCTAQLKIALGEITAAPQGSFMMRTALGKWIAFSNFTWPRGTDTPNEMNVHMNSFTVTDIENEKKELLDYLARTKSASQLMPHPFFGAIRKKEWGRLVYKHINHHLKQFSQ
ncbi:MAG: DUF1569 domain-containing protein [Chryseotalea sp. WA131a]|jgi:hypothetical protein|nr:MAG: DUF1569 domain-containing protein [Chryseotalea sp. WA131a]